MTAHAPASPSRPVPVDGSHLLELAIRVGAAHEGTAISHRQLALAELVAAYRALPAHAMLIMPVVAPPVAEVKREINADGLRYEIAVEGTNPDFIRFSIHDVTGDHAMTHLGPALIRQLMRDLAAVLAAAEGRVR